MRPSLMSWLALAIICLGSCGLCGCQRQAAAPRRGTEKAARTNHVRIRDALAAVLNHHDDKHEALVTFQAYAGNASQFVEFAGSARKGLRLSLPLGKDKAKTERAEAFFQELGIRADENDVYEDPWGEPTGRLRVFRKDFGQDVEAAAKITEQIFERVYQLPADFPLRVICPPELLSDP